MEHPKQYWALLAQIWFECATILWAARVQINPASLMDICTRYVRIMLHAWKTVFTSYASIPSLSSNYFPKSLGFNGELEWRKAPLPLLVRRLPVPRAISMISRRCRCIIKDSSLKPFFLNDRFAPSRYCTNWCWHCESWKDGDKGEQGFLKLYSPIMANNMEEWSWAKEHD